MNPLRAKLLTPGVLRRAKLSNAFGVWLRQFDEERHPRRSLSAYGSDFVFV